MSPDFVVTTNIETTPVLIKEAQDLATEYGGVYVKRHKLTVQALRRQYGSVLIVYKEQLVYVDGVSGEKLFFHPNTAQLRILNGRDPLIEALALPEGARVIDATMGLATDSVVMASFGYHVMAIEANPITELIVRRGLERATSDDARLSQSMWRIETICANSLDYLRQLPDKSVEAVYFDPMFRQEISDSHNLDGVRALANSQPLTAELLEEAKRVASNRIVVKAHFRDDVFERFGLTRIRRKNTKFHYGYLNLEE